MRGGYEKANPFAVIDTECSPPYVVTRYAKREQAQWYLDYLREHGGTVTRMKIDRGGYKIVP